MNAVLHNRPLNEAFKRFQRLPALAQVVSSDLRRINAPENLKLEEPLAVPHRAEQEEAEEVFAG